MCLADQLQDSLDPQMPAMIPEAHVSPSFLLLRAPIETTVRFGLARSQCSKLRQSLRPDLNQELG